MVDDHRKISEVQTDALSLHNAHPTIPMQLIPAETRRACPVMRLKAGDAARRPTRRAATAAGVHHASWDMGHAARTVEMPREPRLNYYRRTSESPGLGND